MALYDFYSWDFLLVALKILFSFIASVLAIFLWAKTRKASEIFFVMGTLSMFLILVYDILLKFGFFQYSFDFLKGFPIFSFIFSLLPYIFFIFSLSFFIQEK